MRSHRRSLGSRPLGTWGFGYHSHESIMRTIELIGKEIIPELENYTPTLKDS